MLNSLNEYIAKDSSFYCRPGDNCNNDPGVMGPRGPHQRDMYPIHSQPIKTNGSNASRETPPVILVCYKINDISLIVVPFSRAEFL